MESCVDAEPEVLAEFVDEVVEVVEVVTLPPGQFRVAADRYVDADGVPAGRTGRRLGGWGIDGYTPGGHRQALPDPMPGRALPTRG